MSLKMPIVLSGLHVIVYQQLIPNKRLTRYFIYIGIIILSVFLSLPSLTYKQAKEKVLNNHAMTIMDTGTIPVESCWNPFAPDRAYYFKGKNASSEEIKLMVVPDTGKVLEINY